MNIQPSKNVPILAPANALFSLKFHQVAIYCNDPDFQVEWWTERGYTDWSFDTAMLSGRDHGMWSEKMGVMAFNYDILPCELEYVTYSSGQRNYMDARDGQVPFISHLSTMVEDVEFEVSRLYDDLAMKPYHTFETSEHTNPAVQGKKRFREAIYDTTGILGFDIKLIQRIPWEE